MGWPDDDHGGGGCPADMQPLVYPRDRMDAAVTACRDVAAALGTALVDRADLVVLARDGWEGVFREDFDTEWGDLETTLGDLKTNLENLASTVESAVGTAGSINTSRQQRRDEYDAQDPVALDEAW
jgi:hypothetical protein